MSRLNRSTLSTLAGKAALPTVDAADVGIVHLGLGAFHRAHQATYTEDTLAQAPGPWAILGADLLGPDIRDRLRAQDNLYTVLEQGRLGNRARIMGIVKEVLVGPENPAALLDRMTDAAVRIVSLTVTEKGYCHDPATGALRADDPGIVHDLANADAPRTAIGYLVRALERRRHAGTGPFTVMSCDNLPNNGRTVKGVVLAFARAVDPALARWIEGTVPFPCTMVDRIVPATTPDDVAAVAAHLGVSDEAPVVCEPFRQWVIEDTFITGRPRWELAGAELVADVAPYEEMKLRILNGSHSALAYLGYLAGYATIDVAVADAAYARFARRLMDDEATPTLKVPAGTDITAYKDDVLERYANPNLKHRTWQIAMDGSQKLPQRLLNTARERFAQGGDCRCVALAVAAWMRYVSAIDEYGQPIEVSDPLAARFKAIADANTGNPAEYARAMLAVEEVFGTDLPAMLAFVDAVIEALEALFADGAKATVAAWG
jgi:fructuronate reductase